MHKDTILSRAPLILILSQHERFYLKKGYPSILHHLMYTTIFIAKQLFRGLQSAYTKLKHHNREVNTRLMVANQ
jgi:hypothetical protein